MKEWTLRSGALADASASSFICKTAFLFLEKGCLSVGTINAFTRPVLSLSLLFQSSPFTISRKWNSISNLFYSPSLATFSFFCCFPCSFCRFNPFVKLIFATSIMTSFAYVNSTRIMESIQLWLYFLKFWKRYI